VVKDASTRVRKCAVSDSTKPAQMQTNDRYFIIPRNEIKILVHGSGNTFQFLSMNQVSPSY
jgi:hypothetical protein